MKGAPLAGVYLRLTPSSCINSIRSIRQHGGATATGPTVTSVGHSIAPAYRFARTALVPLSLNIRTALRPSSRHLHLSGHHRSAPISTMDTAACLERPAVVTGTYQPAGKDEALAGLKACMTSISFSALYPSHHVHCYPSSYRHIPTLYTHWASYPPSLSAYYHLHIYLSTQVSTLTISPFEKTLPAPPPPPEA